jgi:hypothetical protein
MEVTQTVIACFSKFNILSCTYPQEGDKVMLNEEDSTKLELGLFWPVLKGYLPSNFQGETEFSQTNTSFARLCNWNLIIRPLESLGIHINSDTKALIVAGDRMQVVEIVEKLADFTEKGKKRKKPVKTDDGALLLNNIDISTELEEAESVLEFLILTLCKSFKLVPKVAAGLLTQKCNFLTQLIIKGLKGAFDPVRSWYEMMKTFAKSVQKLVENENSSISLIFNCLKAGFSSKNLDIQLLTADIMTLYHSYFKYLESASWEWFNSSPETISAVFSLIQKNQSDVSPLVNFLFIFSKKNLNLVFCQKLKEFCDSTQEYLKILQKLIKVLKNPPYSQFLFNQNLLETWIDVGLRESELDIKNYDSKAISLGFLCDMWLNFPNFIEFKEDLSSNMLLIIKRCLRDSRRPLKTLIYGQMFNLLSAFAASKNSFAPILYKTLTFALIENFSDDKLREFLIQNFSLLFNEILSIPLTILLEPYIKQAQVSKNLNFGICDLDFVKICINHSKLTTKDAVLLLDLLGRVLLNNWIYGQGAVDLFIQIVERFNESIPVGEFIIKFFKISIKLLYIDINPTDRLTESLIKKNVLNVLEKIILIEATELNFELREMMIQDEFRSVKDKDVQVLVSLLGIDQVDKAKGERVYIEEEKKILSIYTKPKGRVMDDLEKVKKRRYDRELKEKEEMERKTQLDNYKKKNLRQQIEKRKIELGIKTKGEPEAIPILNEVYLNEEKNKFFRICDETTEEQFMIDIICKKYARVMKVLFTRYAGSSGKRPFEHMQNTKANLTEPDFSRLLRENCISSIMLSTDELKSLFSFMLMKTKLTSVPYDHFSDLLYATSVVIFSKDPYNYSHFPSCKIFELIFEAFKSNDEKLIPLSLFEEPDPGYGDRDIVKLLNSRLEADPEEPIPEGYQKYKIPVLITDYTSSIGDRSWQISVEILDDLLLNTFGVHLLLPVVHVDYRYRVKGIIKNEDNRLKGINRIESYSGFNHLSSHAKLFAINYQPNQAEIAIEVGRVIDDLIFSVEKNSRVLISKHAKAPGFFVNRVVQERKEIEIHKSLDWEKSELKRKQRAAYLESEVTKIRSQREYKAFVEAKEQEEKVRKAKYQEMKKREKREKEKFELEEKILEYKLSKFEKELKDNETPATGKQKQSRFLRPKSIDQQIIPKKKERHNSESLPRTLKKLNI